MKFAGKSCMITGAGSGIGRAMAHAFAREGAHAICADINEGAATAVADEISARGGRASPFQVDVSQAGQVEALIEFTVSRLDRLDILINNAGVGLAAKVHETAPEDWESVFAVNVRGVYLGCRYSIPVMLRQGGGIIINTASVAGMVGLRDRAAYCASKAAVIGLTKSMAVDYSRQNIRVNAICPATTDTPWVSRVNAHLGTLEEIRAQVNARQALGRMGTPEEIACAAVYLASPEAAFVHGSCLVIDGGLTAQ